MSRDDLSSRKMKIHTILEVANCELAYHNACRYLYGKGLEGGAATLVQIKIISGFVLIYLMKHPVHNSNSSKYQ